MELTLDELKILQDSLDAWVHAGSSGELLGDLLGSMLMKKDTPGYDDYIAEETARKAKLEEEKRNKRERAILIQAKLIQLADKIRAEMLVGAA